MNTDPVPSGPPSSDLLNISEDSQASSALPIREEGSSVTVIEPDSAPHSSEELIPHLAPDDSIPSSHFPEPDLTDTNLENAANQMTSEIFASGTLPAGTMLGHFVIKSYIGGGGMGRVYLATDTALDRKVAVKVLPRQRANDQGTVARFMNEARSAARLNQEHIAQVYFAGEQAGIPYIVFEYVEGTNIRALVEEYNAFPLPQALNYLIQIAHALAHAAEHGVVHRDVKPSNILITKEGRAKLIDMGLARLLDPSESKDDLTASGVTLGTFDYISPEQARDPRNADIRSDIYSLGCTFFYMLSGRPPFPEGTVLQKLLQHQGDEPPDIRTFQPNIPAEVALLLQKMMAKDPRQRFQTPSALIEALVHVAEMLGLHPTGPGKLVWVVNPVSRASVFLKHIPWGSAVLLLLVLFFIMNIYSGRHGSLERPPFPVVEFPDSSSESNSMPPPTATEGESRGSAPPTIARTERSDAVSKPLETVLFPASWFDTAVRQLSSLATSGTEKESGSVPALAYSSKWTSRERFGMGIGAPAVRSQWKPNSEENGNSMSGKLVASVSLVLRDPTSTVLCVDPTGQTPGAYPTLAAALSEAGKQATIELKWNDSQIVQPIALTGRQLKLVAAPGYFPLLSFRPSDTTVYRSMFTLGGSESKNELEFHNVGIEMKLSQDVLASRWTLFEFLGANKLSFDRCILTIRNAATDNTAYHQEVAFFRNSIIPTGFDQMTIDPYSESLPTGFGVQGSSMLFPGNPIPSPMTLSALPNPVSSPSAGTGGKAPGSPESTGISIRMTGCVVRGEATGLQCDVPQSIDFSAESTFIALAKPFIQMEDSKKTARQESKVRITFDLVSFFGRQSFCRQNRLTPTSEPIRFSMETRNSIFVLNQTPLAEFQGAKSYRDAELYFEWDGGESNYFQNISLGWKFRPISAVSEGELVYEMSLPEWENRMNSWPTTDQLNVPEIRKPMSRISPIDLVLKLTSEPTEYASEPIQAGAGADKIPRVPVSWGGSE